MLHHRLFGMAALGVIAGLAMFFSATSAVQAQERAYPHLYAAIYEMREAKAELKEERFNRFRERAVKDLDAAIDETEKALKAAKIEYKYEPPKNAKEYYKAYKDYPHLRHAVVELREALKEVKEEKRHDFGGARDHTIKALETAIERVEEALKGV
jgi:hypothetical protein